MTPPTPPGVPTTILAGPGAASTHPDYSDVAATRDLFWQNIVREMLTSLAVLADARRSQILAEMQTRLGQFRMGNATITTPPDLGPAVPATELAGASAGGGAAGAGGGGAEETEGADGSDGDDEEDPTGGGLIAAGASPGDDDDESESDAADATLPRPGHHPSMPLDGRMAVLTKGGERIPIADVRPLLACSVPGTDAERALSIDVQCTIFQIVAPSGEVFTLPLHEVRAIHAITDELMGRLQRAAHKQDAQAGRPGDDPDSKPFGFAAFTSLAKSRGRGPG